MRLDGTGAPGCAGARWRYVLSPRLDTSPGRSSERGAVAERRLPTALRYSRTGSGGAQAGGSVRCATTTVEIEPVSLKTAQDTAEAHGMFPTDAALLLRVHAEHQWLQDELMSLLDQLEDPAHLRSEELRAALAYLEVTWSEELRRAGQTDAAFRRLEREPDDDEAPALIRQARSYYRGLRKLRSSLAARVEPFVGTDGAMLYGM